jgi:isopenicillin N synthase-like dioxygenase
MHTDAVDPDSFAIPVIDLSALLSHVSPEGEAVDVAAEIGRACRDFGLFYVVNHGVDADMPTRLQALSRQFFAQELEQKLSIRMELGGPAWRGYFPVGSELTSGKPDQKEGVYFGTELGDDHPKVADKVPLHGRNLFPAITGFRETVLAYTEAVTHLGHSLMQGIAVSLGLEDSYFSDRYTTDPLILFRVFHYPALSLEAASRSMWSVGEHTDYGFLTILWQDDSGGLQVKTRDRWIDAPPIPGSFVCNIGDMLQRVTGGLYRSTPHRVRNISGIGRLSFPFFFDPNFDAEVVPIVRRLPFRDDEHERWDRSSVHDFRGTYGEYVLSKVSRVFPELRRTVERSR